MTKFTTKQLSLKTWPDFERLFSQGNGWDSCACLAYQLGVSGGVTARGRKLQKRPSTRAEWGALNRRHKRHLVETGRAHGILVYAKDEPVGWCQFGPAGELPIADDAVATSPETLWKITCFVTLKKYQRQGVAEAALHAALDAMRKKGGGRVEAYPYVLVRDEPKTDKRWREFIRQAGPKSPDVAQHIIRREGAITYYAGKAFLRHGVMIEGAGRVNAVYWRGAAMFHAGTLTMFEREGFKAVGVLPTAPQVRSPWLQASRVIVQRKI